MLQGMKASALTMVVAALSLSNCGPAPVVSQVQAFSSTDAPEPPERVFIFPAVKPGSETLENQTWVRMAEEEFRVRGFVPVKDPRQADLYAGVFLAMNGARDITQSYAVAEWGVTGYSGGYTTGTIQGFGSMATYQGNTTLTPTYGITG